MKKTINYLFAAIALFAAASCTKDIQPNEPNDGQSELRTIEFSFEDSGITKVGVSDRTPQWEAGDKVWISNGTNNEEITLAAADITSNVAKISTSLSGTLYAVYPASAQNGVIDDSGTKKIGFKIPTSTDGTFGNAHIAVAEGTTSLAFKNVVSILKITTEDATKLVNISSASAIAGEFKVTYNTRNVEAGTTQAKGINITSSAAGEKYVAVASDVAFNALEFTAVKTATNWASKKSTQTTDLGINTMYNIGDVSGWSYTTTSSLLWAKFSVAADEQVQFTKGNLYWNGSGSAWALESSQTAYPTTWSTDHVSHLFWTKTAAASYAASYSDGTCTTADKFFADGSDADHSLTIEGQSGLYALSSAEWSYLLSSTTAGGRGDGDSKFKKGVTVNGFANCLVIAPDDYSGTIAGSYDATAWAAAEALGLVCLPAAGYRNGSSLYDAGSFGDYWSASPGGSSKSNAYSLYFDGSDVSPSSYNSRNRGRSVRLVCSVSK